LTTARVLSAVASPLLGDMLVDWVALLLLLVLLLVLLMLLVLLVLLVL